MTPSPAFRRLLVLCALALPTAGACLFQSAPALAETTEWASNEGGRMRIVALAPDTRGVVHGALQIEPKAGWITYWREPGDAGIPPQISFPEASGIRMNKMSYPAPKRFDNGDLRDIGYDTPVAFPFELQLDDAGNPSATKATAFIGICRNICIPFQAEFSLALKPDTGTSFAEAMVINDAEARLPKAPSDDFRVTHHAMSVDGKTLQVKLRLPKGSPKKPKVIVTGPEGHVLFGDGKGKPSDGDYVLDMPIGKLPEGYEMRGKRWGILVLAGDRAMETSLPFE
jgi:DsbC/DsbD-like thiol-disulfide interchange protein